MPNEGKIQAGQRTLAYLEVGDPLGPLVLHNHGGPSSRLEAALFDAAAKAHGLRFVGVDRPGIGAVGPAAGPQLPGLGRGSVAGCRRAGCGPIRRHRLVRGRTLGPRGCGLPGPARLVHVACIGGGSYGAFGANWAAKYLSSADALGGRLALHFHPGFKLMYELIGLGATHFEQSYAKTLLKAVNAADRQVLADEQVMKLFLAASHECFRQGADGLVADATLLYDAWPFDMTKLQRAVHFWQGSADTLVPEIINKTVAEKTPGAVWHPVSGGGHFIALSHANHILALAAQDLA